MRYPTCLGTPIAVTGDVYGHTSDDRAIAAVDKLAQRLGPRRLVASSYFRCSLFMKSKKAHTTSGSLKSDRRSRPQLSISPSGPSAATSSR